MSKAACLLKALASMALFGLTASLSAKGLPQGVYESAAGLRMAGDNIVSRTPLIPGQDGILVRAGWNLCGDDQTCLLDTIALNLDTARDLGLKVALAIGDGDHAPPGVKSTVPATLQVQMMAGSSRPMEVNSRMPRYTRPALSELLPLCVTSG